MKMEVCCGRWVFTGITVPMELAGRSWGDKYAAVAAANRAGYEVSANFSVTPIAERFNDELKRHKEKRK